MTPSPAFIELMDVHAQRVDCCHVLVGDARKAWISVDWAAKGSIIIPIVEFR